MNLFSRFLKDLQTIFGDSFISKRKHQQKSLFSSHYDQIWKSKLISSTKDEFYYKFKPFIKLEQYLTLTQNCKQRVSYSVLRLCHHKMNIEVLHHQKFKVPLCFSECEDEIHFNECEDEIHFLLNCDKLREQHQSFEQKLGKFSIKHSANLTNEEKLIFLFSDENPGICRILAQTIHNTFQVRDKYSQSYDLYFRYMMVMYSHNPNTCMYMIVL